MEWLKNNDAGGGAFKLESWKPGQETIYVRFDDWKSGPLPKLKRVIMREVPSAGNRRALLERGDADISFDLPPKDFAELAKAGKVAVVGMPVENACAYVGMNVKTAPFDNVKVRQAVAYAMPVREDLRARRSSAAACCSRACPSRANTAGYDPALSPYQDRHRARPRPLMAEAGFPNGFETTLSFDQGFATINEPTAVLRPGVARPDRHQDHHQQDPGRELARRAAQEGHADLSSTASAAGSTTRSTSSSGTITARTRCSTRCPTRTRRWTS